MRLVLTGQTESHLCSPAEASSLGVLVHRDVVGPFRELQGAARGAGHDLRILSGFRGFERQLAVTEAVLADKNILILSDRAQGPERIPMPALLATAAVHHHLVRQGLRMQKIGRAHV